MKKERSQSTKSWPLPLAAAAAGILTVLYKIGLNPESTLIQQTRPPDSRRSHEVQVAIPAQTATSREHQSTSATSEALRVVDEQVAQRARAIDSSISVQAAVGPGKFEGLRIFPGRTADADLFARLGLFAGDRVVAIEGMSLDDPQMAFEAWRAATAGRFARVTADRDGQLLDFSFDFDDVAASASRIDSSE